LKTEVLTPVEIDKRLKALKKKLKLIEELKQRGGEMNEDQVKKIESEDECVRLVAEYTEMQKNSGK
jgi:uncharacterized protein with WD repeat